MTEHNWSDITVLSLETVKLDSFCVLSQSFAENSKLFAESGHQGHPLLECMPIVTCKEENVEDQVQLIPKQHVDHLHAEKGRDEVQHNTEHNGYHLHVEEGEDQVKLNPEHHDAHCMQKKVKIVKLPPEQHVDHLHEEEDQVQVLLVFFSCPQQLNR